MSITVETDSMKILIDENIVHGRKLFEDYGEVTFKPGRNIKAEDLKNIDVLLVRSVTKVDENLLRYAKKIKFVGSCTAGIDHIDINYLMSKNIAFFSAPGSNKIAVSEYVLAVIMYYGKKYNFNFTDKVIGLVGMGNVGSYLYGLLKTLNLNVLICDPLIEKKGDHREFCDIEYICENADIISLHCSLIHDANFSSYHLFNSDRLNNLKANTILINASRGDVIDEGAFLGGDIKNKFHITLDVFENEPFINKKILSYVDLFTPHIAGYSVEGKIKGSWMIYDDFCGYFGYDKKYEFCELLPTVKKDFFIDGEVNNKKIMQLIEFAYNVEKESSDFSKTLCTTKSKNDIGKEFDLFRKNYAQRREFSSICVRGLKKSQDINKLKKLGFTVLEYD